MGAVKLLATTSAPFDFVPPEGVEVVWFEESARLPPGHLDADAAIVVGGATPAVAQLAREASRLRWVQTLAAGPDGVLAAGFGPQVAICNGRGLHERTVAEAAVMLALAGILRLPEALDAQRAHRWAEDELGGWRALHPAGRLGSLIDTNVLIWGFGSIGQRAARLFDALAAHVRGVARTAGERSGFPVSTPEELPDLLPTTDVLVMVLPGSPENAGVMDARLLALLPPHAWLVNVGRGSTVDEPALVDALRSGRLGGAALDVLSAEPYPADGPLWDCPRTIITPHIAGGVAHGSNALLNANITRLRAGEPLLNLVER